MKKEKINNFGAYFDKFALSKKADSSDCDNSSEIDEEKLWKVIEIALDTRKFEIQLYWKRATYFWAFITATITAFLVVEIKHEPKFSIGIQILLMFIGFMIAIIWYYVNRGSKFWQENWEKNLEFLLKRYGTPIYQMILVPKHPYYRLMYSYPYSVSKLNQMVSFLPILFWIVTAILMVCYKFPVDCICWKILSILGILISAAVLVWLIHFKCRSFAAEQFEKDFDGVFINSSK